VGARQLLGWRQAAELPRPGASIHTPHTLQVTTAVLSGELPWQRPNDEDYNLLAQESEYAAW
jgi:hypothetical protein